MTGFLTHIELKEARMLSRLRDLTAWQKFRLVQLFTKQQTGKRLKARDDIHNDWIETSKDFFINYEKIS
jgi:hypothetical protein